MAIIDKIKISGTSYDIRDENAATTKQDVLVSGTNIKTINNESILGSGNIEIQGGGGMDDNTQQLISTAFNDLNDRKIDASEVRTNYQIKGDYATKSYLSSQLSSYQTTEDATEKERVAASALVDLNNKFGGLSLVKLTQAEYDALTTKDSNTLYIIAE